jgi:acyl-homoserine-lactone acylase
MIPAPVTIRDRRVAVEGVAVLCLATLCLAMLPTRPSGGHTELLWDQYGVPHIFAADTPALFRAFGYAQTHSHGELILRLYAQARGRAAEYWDKRYLASDRWVRTNDVPGRAAQWYAAQRPDFRAALDAFADGVNAYARDHPDRLSDSAKRVLPISGIDLLAHTQRVMLYLFVTSAGQTQAAIEARPRAATAASNAWAIAGSRTASGAAILLGNPHLNWDDATVFYEAELAAPGVQLYGATLVGFPVLGIAFNDRLGWTHTVNAINGSTLYELEPASGGYLFDGVVKPFETREETIRVRQPDNSLTSETLVVRQSVHGPIVGDRGGHPVALKMASLDASGLCQQWWDMGRAQTRREFEAALARRNLPMFNVVYADADGHILYVFNGRVPVHDVGDWDTWRGVMPGNTSKTLWTDTLAYDQLPRLLDAPRGWIQNSNDAPWSSTFPAVLARATFPAYLTSPTGISLRSQRSVHLLTSAPRVSLDDVVRLKYSTRMELADRIVDDLVAAARESGRPTALRAAEILANWDRSTDADSRGAVLFERFARLWERAAATGLRTFAQPWREDAPFDTPKGLADPAGAVAVLDKAALEVEKTYGSMDVRWGDVYRFRKDDVDLPGNGGPSELGIFRVVNYTGGPQGTQRAIGGDSFVMVVEFGRKIEARALLGYGNASQPQSPHRTDQLRFMASKALRPVWRGKGQVEAHLEAREVF